MALFVSKNAPPAGGGLELLRAVTRSRKMGLASLAHEIGTATHLLESFIGGGSLPVDKLNAIAGLVFGSGVTYDSETDLLQRAPQPEPIAMGVHPPQCERRPLSDIVPTRPVPKTTVNPDAGRPSRRPGWAD